MYCVRESVLCRKIQFPSTQTARLPWLRQSERGLRGKLEGVVCVWVCRGCTRAEGGGRESVGYEERG